MNKPQKDKAAFITTLIVMCIIIVVYGGYVLVKNAERVNPPLENNMVAAPPVFVWSFEEDDSLNPDGNPQTNVYLEAKYPNGKAVGKLIMTSHGGCSLLEDSDDAVQCYGAGLGYRFRITKAEKMYLIERQTFEEGSPDYNPPVQEYEVVAEFPLSM